MTTSKSMFAEDLAARWSCVARTIHRYRAAGAPLEDDDKMCDWLDKQEHVSLGTQKKVRDHRAAQAKAKTPDLSGAPGEATENEWEKFIAGRTADDPRQAMEKLMLARDFASMKFQRAAQTEDERGQKFYTDMLAKMEATLNAAQVLAKKLGIEEGELLPRKEVERILRAWAFWAMKSVDVDLSDLCKNLTGLARVNDARAVLEPALLSARFLKPFARASRIESPSALPTWIVETLRDAVDDYIENGAKEFDAAASP